jgi:hypothetical protein
VNGRPLHSGNTDAYLSFMSSNGTRFDRGPLTRRTTMTKFKLVGAALVLAAFAAAPVSAQQAISEPGAFAFYHPNADVLNAGAPTPAAGGFAAPTRPADSMAQMQMSVRPHHMRHMMKHH